MVFVVMNGKIKRSEIDDDCVNEEARRLEWS